MWGKKDFFGEEEATTGGVFASLYLILFEERDGEYFKGHTKNYMMVKLKTSNNLENQIVNVKIVDADEECLIAE